jgi:hypothetical protein
MKIEKPDPDRLCARCKVKMRDTNMGTLLTFRFSVIHPKPLFGEWNEIPTDVDMCEGCGKLLWELVCGKTWGALTSVS